MIRIAIFVSGNGTNCENIIRHFHHHTRVKVALVLSNRADAYALVRAQNHHIPTVVVNKADFNREDLLLPLMRQHGIDFIVLAGFLLMIPPFLVKAYHRRMLNLHPALLPKYGGRGMYGHHVHEAVKAAGETETGMTVHWVSEECDGGEIIAQFRTPLSLQDTPEEIAAKEHLLEEKHFPTVIERVLTSLKGYALLLVALLCTLSAAAQKGGKAEKWPSFLSQKDLPEATQFIPAPPDTSSIAFLKDFDRYQWGKSMRNTPRGRQAVFDAYVEVDSILKGFQEAFGMLISKDTTPEIYSLVQRVENDGSLSVRGAKKKYMRKRPYVQFHEPTGVPEDEDELRHSGSFPSGHTARGWAIALVLAELNPDRQDAILRRGYEYGESRVIVGYHYQSDVDVARIAASGAVARLHADEAFARQLAKAKKEWKRCKKE